MIVEMMEDEGFKETGEGISEGAAGVGQQVK
jgi:hypothetical protein